MLLSTILTELQEMRTERVIRSWLNIKLLSNTIFSLLSSAKPKRSTRVKMDAGEEEENEDRHKVKW